MKKLNILFLLTLVVIFTQSCKKKNDEPAPLFSEAHLLKAWKVTKFEIDDPTITNSDIDQDLRETFAKDNGQQTFALNIIGPATGGTWTLTGNQLTIKAASESLVRTVVSLSAHEFVYTETTKGKDGKQITSTTTMVPGEPIVAEKHLLKTWAIKTISNSRLTFTKANEEGKLAVNDGTTTSEFTWTLLGTTLTTKQASGKVEKYMVTLLTPSELIIKDEKGVSTTLIPA